MFIRHFSILMALLLTNKQTDRFASEVVLKTYQRLFLSLPRFSLPTRKNERIEKIVMLQDVFLL